MTLLAFIGLQAMDVVTTLLFLHNGVPEANPLIRAVLAMPAHPGISLLIAKCFPVALATYAWRTGRTGLLQKMNVLFAACVVWNLLANIAGRAGGAS